MLRKLALLIAFETIGPLHIMSYLFLSGDTLGITQSRGSLSSVLFLQDQVVVVLSSVVAFAVALSDVRLREEDVPGASLGKHADGRVRKPHELCVPELKRWLACRGARWSGNKADLVQRLVMFAIFSY